MDIPAACLDMFQRHRVEAFGGTFHVPAAKEYSCLFSWDSGYHALALRHLDTAFAEEELRTLFRANTTPEGLLAHERPLPGAEARTQMVTQWLGPIYRPDGLSWLIDPPVAAFAAAMMVDGAHPGRAALLAASGALLQAIDRLRTLTPGGTPVILHPLESGADVSPLFDSLVDASSRVALLTSHRALSARLAEIEYSTTRARDEGHVFIVSDPILCGWHLLALEATADALRRAGQAGEAEAFDIRASTLGEEMLRLMWSEELSLFVGYDHVNERQLAVATLGGIIAAASDHMVSSGIGATVVDEHLRRQRSRFWGKAGVAFNPLDGNAINPKALLWRGDVVWGATQYWAHLVLCRNGHADLAIDARGQMERLIADAGFREFYSAVDGRGYGAGARDGFTWPALALEMRAEESRASEHGSRPQGWSRRWRR